MLVQYADDICMWMNLAMKRKTPARNLNYIEKLYQNEPIVTCLKMDLPYQPIKRIWCFQF